MDKHVFGKWAESVVLELYCNKGYKIIAKNFQFYSKGHQGRNGELDLIFYKKDLLVIVEVKARQNLSYGRAGEQISKKKLQTLYKTIQYFLLKNNQFLNMPVRFDVATVTTKKIQIIPNAFSFDGFL